jgi:uncharacterized protein (DUF3084 family)
MSKPIHKSNQSTNATMSNPATHAVFADLDEWDNLFRKRNIINEKSPIQLRDERIERLEFVNQKLKDNIKGLEGANQNLKAQVARKEKAIQGLEDMVRAAKRYEQAHCAEHHEEKETMARALKKIRKALDDAEESVCLCL